MEKRKANSEPQCLLLWNKYYDPNRPNRLLGVPEQWRDWLDLLQNDMIARPMVVPLRFRLMPRAMFIPVLSHFPTRDTAVVFAERLYHAHKGNPNLLMDRYCQGGHGPHHYGYVIPPLSASKNEQEEDTYQQLVRSWKIPKVEPLCALPGRPGVDLLTFQNHPHVLRLRWFMTVHHSLQMIQYHKSQEELECSFAALLWTRNPSIQTVVKTFLDLLFVPSATTTVMDYLFLPFSACISRWSPAAELLNPWVFWSDLHRCNQFFVPCPHACDMCLPISNNNQ